MKLNTIFLLFTLSGLACADDATDKAELLAGEKFVDQYFRPPPATEKGVMLAAGDIPIASALLPNVTDADDQNFRYKLELEQAWKLAELTSDPDAKKLDTDPDPETWKQAEKESVQDSPSPDAPRPIVETKEMSP